MFIEAVTVDDGVLHLGCPFLPTFNLMITQTIVMLIARITTIATSPISDTKRGINILLLLLLLPNEVYVGGLLVAMLCIEVLAMVVVTIAVIVDVVSAPGVLTVVVILHSSMKS